MREWYYKLSRWIGYIVVLRDYYDVETFTLKKKNIEFTQWKDSNFLLYADGTYYTKTSSKYFDITKYIGKHKPTKYYTINQLVQLYQIQIKEL